MIEQAQSLFEQMVAWRRDFHRFPELGFRETRTAAKVAEALETLGYRVRRGVGRSGVVAEIGRGAPIVAIRADMDALPIQELNECGYASQNAGVMHACGHDSHMAMALAAAHLLKNESLRGTLRFLFQPSEEGMGEDGISGAPAMMRDGALDGVGFIVALHVDPYLPLGSIGSATGAVAGGLDSWDAAVIGAGGHGASPHLAVDPFFLAAQAVNALNGIVSRRVDPFAPAVVSIGALRGGFTHNVIPERVEMLGTLRYTDKTVREKIHAEMRAAFEVTRALGGRYELNFQSGYPPMVNHRAASDLIAQAGADLLGAQNILPPIQTLGAEDFAFYLEQVPGAMFSLGAQLAGDQRHFHHPRFEIDERAMPIGAGLLAETARRYFQGKEAAA